MLPNAYGILNTGRIATKYDIGFHVPDPGAGELVEVSTVLPVSDTKSEEITNTLAWSLGGKLTGGIECEITAKDKGTEAGCKAKLGAELSFGVTTSESHKFTKKDVEIANNSASNSLSWSFNILPPKLFFEGIMQLHSWYAPAILARSTFQPEMTWVWRVSDTYRQRYKDGLPVVVEFTPKLFHAYRRYSFPWWQANEVYLGPEKPFTMQVTLPWPPTTATVKK